ncbi:MAG: coproporphyrinogen dehydrogenase HemZ, partial [Clostridia bacterium]|nr:coproporphyrinogen dehydrogenase HemZ [Clostridia bacterium]
MNLFLERQEYFYEMENICRLFFPHIKFEKNPTDTTGDFAKCEFIAVGDELRAICTILYGEKQVCCEEVCPVPDDVHEQEITMARGLYRLFSQITGISPKWGILTGVRPSKLYSSLMSEQHTSNQVQEYMNQRLLVEKEKLELCHQCYLSENTANGYCDGRSFSLYISIPFCPTRCSYCSFVSHSIEKTAKMIPEYVEKLCIELKETAAIAKTLGLVLKTIYWGGGTPTQLSADQLDVILNAIEANFDLSNLLEHTVEGGRPDTITPEKLQ